MRNLVALLFVGVASSLCAQDKVPRGYSVPLIDLAEQKARQIIVDQEVDR